MAIPERRPPEPAHEELKTQVRKRLNGLTAGGPRIDPRTASPYEWLEEEYVSRSSDYQILFSRVLADLLKELLTGREEWNREASRGLFALLQCCGHRLSSTIKGWVDTFRIQNEEDRERLALLLKAHLELGHRESVPFWLQQKEKLGPEYGALIFAGLMKHGPEVAAQYLEELCQNNEAVQGRIEALLPVLCDEFGGHRVLAALGMLPEPLSSELRRAMDLGWPHHGVPGTPPEPASTDTKAFKDALYEYELVGSER